MTDDLIAQLKAAHDAAVPGPWVVEGVGGIHVDGTSDRYEIKADRPPTGCLMRVATGNRAHKSEADLVVLLRNALPEIIAALEERELLLRMVKMFVAEARAALDALEKKG